MATENLLNIGSQQQPPKNLRALQVNNSHSKTSKHCSKTTQRQRVLQNYILKSNFSFFFVFAPPSFSRTRLSLTRRRFRCRRQRGRMFRAASSDTMPRWYGFQPFVPFVFCHVEIFSNSVASISAPSFVLRLVYCFHYLTPHFNLIDFLCTRLFNCLFCPFIAFATVQHFSTLQLSLPPSLFIFSYFVRVLPKFYHFSPFKLCPFPRSPHR